MLPNGTDEGLSIVGNLKPGFTQPSNPQERSANLDFDTAYLDHNSRKLAVLLCSDLRRCGGEGWGSNPRVVAHRSLSGELLPHQPRPLRLNVHFS